MRSCSPANRSPASSRSTKRSDRTLFCSQTRAVFDFPLMARANQITMCSFCGKSRAEVKKLVAGPGVYICDSCVFVCKSVLDKEFRSEAQKQLRSLNVPKPGEIKAYLDQYIVGQEEAKRTLSVS